MNLGQQRSSTRVYEVSKLIIIVYCKWDHPFSSLTGQIHPDSKVKDHNTPCVTHGQRALLVTLAVKATHSLARNNLK